MHAGLQQIYCGSKKEIMTFYSGIQENNLFRKDYFFQYTIAISASFKGAVFLAY
jgi:hypothetical protein